MSRCETFTTNFSFDRQGHTWGRFFLSVLMSMVYSFAGLRMRHTRGESTCRILRCRVVQ